MGRPTLVVWFPSQTAFLGMVRDLTKKMAESAGFDLPTCERLALAVDEAATNVVQHAYEGDPGQRVEMRYEDRGAELRVHLVDTGARVECSTLPAVDVQRYAAERRTGGLGVHLMQKIMDSVSFERSPGCNVCCLVKRKPEGHGESR